MWAFLANLISIFAGALKLWHEDKLRREGREAAVQDAKDAQEKNEAAATAASADPVVIERVRSRWDRARRGTNE